MATEQKQLELDKVRNQYDLFDQNHNTAVQNLYPYAKNKKRKSLRADNARQRKSVQS